MSGSLNKILEVDLDSGKVSTRVVEPDLYRTFVGGSSLAARLSVDDLGFETLSESFAPVANNVRTLRNSRCLC
jgi:aldehyde:ferredoxin oxidoreductase